MIRSLGEERPHAFPLDLGKGVSHWRLFKHLCGLLVTAYKLRAMKGGLTVNGRFDVQLAPNAFHGGKCAVRFVLWRCAVIRSSCVGIIAAAAFRSQSNIEPLMI
jgi:hypothetical protein